MAIETWPSKEIREEFFRELRELIARYPNIADRMVREYNDDPSDDGWDTPDGYSDFDPASPTFLQGVVVVVSYANLDHFEDLTVLDPFDQSRFLTDGMLSKANTSFGIGTSTD